MSINRRRLQQSLDRHRFGRDGQVTPQFSIVGAHSLLAGSDAGLRLQTLVLSPESTIRIVRAIVPVKPSQRAITIEQWCTPCRFYLFGYGCGSLVIKKSTVDKDYGSGSGRRVEAYAIATNVASYKK